MAREHGDVSPCFPAFAPGHDENEIDGLRHIRRRARPAARPGLDCRTYLISIQFHHWVLNLDLGAFSCHGAGLCPLQRVDSGLAGGDNTRELRRSEGSLSARGSSSRERRRRRRGNVRRRRAGDRAISGGRERGRQRGGDSAANRRGMEPKGIHHFDRT